MITIPTEISTAALVTLAAWLFTVVIFVLGLLAYWKGRIYRLEAEILKKDAERDKKSAIDERNKAELVLEEAKRHGYRPERRPVSGKWGRLGFSDGRATVQGPVGPEHAGPPDCPCATGHTAAFSGPTDPTGHPGPGRASGKSQAETESDLMVAMLEFQKRQALDMNDRYIALFKEVMTH